MVPTLGLSEEVEVVGELAWPYASPDWTKNARGLYKAFKFGPQSQFYIQSDCFAAWHCCNLISQMEQTGYIASLLAEWNKLMVELLATEGSRRRLRLELKRDTSKEDAKQATVSSQIANYKKAAS